MLSLRALLLACVMLVSGAWLTMFDQRVAAQQAHDPAPLEVTTDTPGYCLHLQERIYALIVGATTPPPREATDLTQEGQRMCKHGQTRGGIMRLRRALLLIQHDGPSIER